jgi:hypothetical protein
MILASLYKYIKIEIISCILSRYNAVKVEINTTETVKIPKYMGSEHFILE